MSDVLQTLLEAGPAYLLAATLLAILIWDRRSHREQLKQRDQRLDQLANQLYEVAVESVKKDAQVLGVLEIVRRDVERFGK